MVYHLLLGLIQSFGLCWKSRVSHCLLLAVTADAVLRKTCDSLRMMNYSVWHKAAGAAIVRDTNGTSFTMARESARKQIDKEVNRLSDGWNYESWLVSSVWGSALMFCLYLLMWHRGFQTAWRKRDVILDWWYLSLFVLFDLQNPPYCHICSFLS